MINDNTTPKPSPPEEPADKGLDDAACSPCDIANGLLHAADDHPCCRATLYAAANILTNMHTEAEVGDVVSWAMKETTLEKARQALQAGMENTDQLLMDHDRSLGRTTRKNKGEAERLEQDIRDMKSSLESLMAPDGRFFPFIEENASGDARRPESPLAQTTSRRRIHPIVL